MIIYYLYKKYDAGLSDEQMKNLASKLKCTVYEIGKIKGKERWEYKLERKQAFTKRDNQTIRNLFRLISSDETPKNLK